MFELNYWISSLEPEGLVDLEAKSHLCVFISSLATLVCFRTTLQQDPNPDADRVITVHYHYPLFLLLLQSRCSIIKQRLNSGQRKECLWQWWGWGIHHTLLQQCNPHHLENLAHRHREWYKKNNTLCHILTSAGRHSGNVTKMKSDLSLGWVGLQLQEMWSCAITDYWFGSWKTFKHLFKREVTWTNTETDTEHKTSTGCSSWSREQASEWVN